MSLGSITGAADTNDSGRPFSNNPSSVVTLDLDCHDYFSNSSGAATPFYSATAAKSAGPTSTTEVPSGTRF